MRGTPAVGLLRVPQPRVTSPRAAFLQPPQPEPPRAESGLAATPTSSLCLAGAVLKAEMQKAVTPGRGESRAGGAAGSAPCAPKAGTSPCGLQARYLQQICRS